jgi:hypothetical protein
MGTRNLVTSKPSLTVTKYAHKYTHTHTHTHTHYKRRAEQRIYDFTMLSVTKIYIACNGEMHDELRMFFEGSCYYVEEITP